jgi:bla regulator protein blaR1
VEERERACDEQVLESGNDRQVYAETILKICEFCVGSRLACVSGVTGADLKKRIARIMTERLAGKLDFSRTLLLSAAGLLAVAAPIGVGLLHATQSRGQSQDQNTVVTAPVYDVVSIKLDKSATDIVKTCKGVVTQRIVMHPGDFTATGHTLQTVIGIAYGVEDFQISGAPSWLNSDVYDVEAKANQSVVDELRKLSPEQP